MMPRIHSSGFLSVILLLLTACDGDPAPAAGDFTVLTQSAPGFAQASPEQPIRFPEDHGSHPDFRVEWWYLTANLEDAGGRQYGAQWTLFRTATSAEDAVAADNGNSWLGNQLYMAHLGLTWPDGHSAFQRYARGGRDPAGQAGVIAAPFAAWLDDWRMASTGSDWLPLRVQARQDDMGLDLTLDSARLPVLQGINGFSQKHPDGGGSHYYSQPFLQAQGHLLLDGRRVPVAGEAWLDREWSSQFLQAGQLGWDWFALHLESGEKLMAFQLRTDGDPSEYYRHAVLLGADGSRMTVKPEQLLLEPVRWHRVAGRRIPTRWRMQLQAPERRLTITALHPDQWMAVDFAYWEGVVMVSGDSAGERGRGYLEMTGYPARGK